MVRAFQLKITLERVKPQVWRRVMVPGNLNFERLHGVIQDAMGWEWDHLHEFVVGDLRIGPEPEDDRFGMPVADERQYTLERLFQDGDRFRYVYDFGDNWTHGDRGRKGDGSRGDVRAEVRGGRARLPA